MKLNYFDAWFIFYLWNYMSYQISIYKFYYDSLVMSHKEKKQKIIMRKAIIY